MPIREPAVRDTLTVICRWHPPGDGFGPGQFIAVVITHCDDTLDAADNAGLFLIWDRQGMAEPWLVIDGQADVFIPHGGVFDADDFDETITFTGKIVSVGELS
jgi:hypothetical protein